MSEWEQELLKRLFEVGLAVDRVDQHIEVEQDQAAALLLSVVAVTTSDFWKALELLHVALHQKFDVPVSIEYCGEHPDQKIGLR